MDDAQFTENKFLRNLLEEKNKEITYLKEIVHKYENVANNSSKNNPLDNGAFCYRSDSCYLEEEGKKKISLSKDDVARYSRQLILPEIGVAGQLALKKSSALIIGAGGLGCPAGVYLAAAGIGKIGIVDYDEIERSNLHRQILHKETRIGLSKVISFVMAVNDVNSDVQCLPYKVILNRHNAKDIICQYDIVIDASDNVATRYLLNDACVLYQKPLVSGSALRMEGQLTVYNYKNGPCYRCLFPIPPDPGTTTSCSEGGVLGVVPGVIGCLQALEAIKLAIGLEPSYYKKMLLFDGKCGSFLTINLRPKKQSCDVCGENPSIRHLIDYEQFCGASATDKVQSVALLSENERISCKEYKDIIDKKIPHLLIDVRNSLEVRICSLPNAINIPYLKMENEQEIEKLKAIVDNFTKEKNSFQNFVICHHGNDSQKAVLTLQNVFSNSQIKWKDIKGGLHAWANEVDSDFPVY